MRRSLYVLFVLISVGMLSAAYAAEKASMGLKVGDEVYACNCGAQCGCNMMAKKAGKCPCGEAMVKAEVVRIEGGTAYLKADNWKEERPFSMTGKYVCACGPGCKCDAVSQKPGKCPCGMEMKNQMMEKGKMMKDSDMMK